MSSVTTYQFIVIFFTTEANKALRFPLLQTRKNKLKQLLLKLAVEKYRILNLGKDLKKIKLRLTLLFSCFHW